MISGAISEIFTFREWKISYNPKKHTVVVVRHNTILRLHVVQKAESKDLRKWSLVKALFNVDVEGSSMENIYQKFPPREEDMLF